MGETGPSLPHPLPCKLTWKYNYIDLYFGVVLSFLFSFKNFVPVTAENRVRVRVSSRVRVRVRVRVQGSSSEPVT